jgi:hypothetical protein
MSTKHATAADRDFESDEDEPEVPAAAVDDEGDPRDLGLVLDAAALKAAYSKIAKLISVVETHSSRIVKSILEDRVGAWKGTERRGDFLWMPASVLGLTGGAIRVHIAEEAFEPPADVAATDSDSDGPSDSDAPEPKKRKPNYKEEARSLFQHADVKQLLRAMLGDKVATANEAACAAVEAAERAEAQARLEKAYGIKTEKKRALEVERASKQLERVGRVPKTMPPPDAGPGEANEKLGQVLSQLGGSLWHLAKRENGEAALKEMVKTAKERPGALLETHAFKAAFKVATGEEMPVLQLLPCAGCRALGCTLCRGDPSPPMEVAATRDAPGGDVSM